MSSNSNLFNVPEPAADANTTAGAFAAAHSPAEARKVEAQVEGVQHVAGDVASVAESKGYPLTGERSVTEELKHTTNAAVAEGKQDVQTGGYVEQAKNVAVSAMTTAQAYIPEAVVNAGVQVKAAIQPQLDAAAAAAAPHLEKAQASLSSMTGMGAGNTTTTTTTNPSSTNNSAGSTVIPAVSAIPGAVANAGVQAKAAMQPHLDAAAAAAAPHIEKAQASISSMTGMGTGNTNTTTTTGSGNGIPSMPPASSTGIPAVSAPLHSDNKTASEPYPTGQAPL